MIFPLASGCQLVLQSETKYFCQGSIIADSREAATGLMVITSGHVGVELPMDSDEADEEHRTPGGKTLLYVFTRGSAAHTPKHPNIYISTDDGTGTPLGGALSWGTGDGLGHLALKPTSWRGLTAPLRLFALMLSRREQTPAFSFLPFLILHSLLVILSLLNSE